MHKEQLRGDAVYLIHELLTPEQCRHYVELSESHGYDEAPITTGAGFVMRKDIRNNLRVMIDSHEIASDIWGRAQSLVPDEWFYSKAKGLNERFRFYKYEKGQRFATHSDGYFQRDNGEKSELTFIIYLNDDFTGGETAFFGSDKFRVRPQTGSALVFAHKQLHEGVTVQSGVKYVMRTDVMYGLP